MKRFGQGYYLKRELGTQWQQLAQEGESNWFEVVLHQGVLEV